MSWEKRLRGLMVGAAFLSLGVSGHGHPGPELHRQPGSHFISNVVEARKDAEAPKAPATLAYQPVSQDFSDQGPESPGNFSDRVPRDKRYKLKAFFHNMITLPN